MCRARRCRAGPRRPPGRAECLHAGAVAGAPDRHRHRRPRQPARRAARVGAAGLPAAVRHRPRRQLRVGQHRGRAARSLRLRRRARPRDDLRSGRLRGHHPAPPADLPRRPGRLPRRQRGVRTTASNRSASNRPASNRSAVPALQTPGHRRPGRNRGEPLPRSTRRLVTALAAATVASTLAACGGGSSGDGGGGGGGSANEASDVGVTADTIKIGSHYPLTGVAAPGYSTIPLGAQAYFDYVNDNGGVNGRKIDWVYKDDGYNPTNTSAVVNDLVLKEEVFAVMGGLGTPTHSAVIDFLNSEGVPDLFVASGSLTWGDDPKTNPMTFGWQTDYESEGNIIGKYIAEKFPNAKVGLFLQDDDFGENGEKGVREYIDKQIVDAQRYTPGNTNVGPWIAALKAAGADFVVGFNVPSYTALSQLTALQLGYKPQWFYSNVGSDPSLVGALLNRFSQGKVTDAALLDGALTTEYLPSVDQPDNPWTQLFQKVWDASGQEGELTNYRIYGMAEAYTFVQALQAAGQNPTREGIVDALEQSGADFEGPTLAPFRYSEDRHAGVGGMLVSQITGTSSEEKTPVLVTDNGDGDITEYDGEASTPPSSGIPDEEPAEG